MFSLTESQSNEQCYTFTRKWIDAKFAKSLSDTERHALTTRIVTQIFSKNITDDWGKAAEKIIQRLGFSSIKVILKILFELGCVGISAYVTILYYQLAIVACEKFGQQFGITLFENNGHLLQLIGIATFIAITTVYTRCCHDTAIEEYAAFKRCCRGVKPTFKGVLARVSAIIPALSLAVLAYPENGLSYSIAVGIVLFALLGVGIKKLFDLSAKKALFVLLLGAPGFGYFVSPFGLKPFTDNLHNLMLNIPLGIGTGLAFAAFAGNGGIELWNRFRADLNNHSNNFSLNALKVIKWTVLTLIGLAAGFATSEVWAKTMALFGCDNCIAVPITMIFGMFAGCLFNGSSMDKFLMGAFTYFKNTFWIIPKTILENVCYRCQGLSTAGRIDKTLNQMISTTLRFP